MFVTFPKTILLLLVLVVALAGCDRGDSADSAWTLEGRTMGTYWLVRVSVPPETLDRESLQARLEEHLERVNAQMSIYDPESEVSRFNRAPLDTWQEVSPELFKVVATAQQVSEQSEGAFDATIGPLVALWGFAADAGPADGIPSADAIARALEQVSWKKVELDPAGQRLRRTAEVELDLGGIAKGYGVDVLADHLEQVGVTDYMVDIGGDLRAAGRSPRGDKWRIGIEVPAIGARGGVQEVLEMHDVALTTSGDYRNFFVHEGVHYAHTIDPATGWPLERHVASVTVLHDTAMLADAWATALNVMGPDQGLELAEALSLPVYFILYNDGELEVRYSSYIEPFLAGE